MSNMDLTDFPEMSLAWSKHSSGAISFGTIGASFRTFDNAAGAAAWLRDVANAVEKQDSHSLSEKTE